MTSPGSIPADLTSPNADPSSDPSSDPSASSKAARKLQKKLAKREKKKLKKQWRLASNPHPEAISNDRYHPSPILDDFAALSEGRLPKLDRKFYEKELAALREMA